MADLIPFDDFVRSLKKKRTRKSLGIVKNRAAGDKASGMMQDFLANHYKRMKAVHSYVDADGQVWDCIPIEQQPALRGTDDRLFEKEPALPDMPSGKDVNLVLPVSECPPGAIPMRRVTLEEMVRYDSLSSFFKKEPTRASTQKMSAAPSTGVHHWSYARELADNRGGEGLFNIWQPQVSGRQLFSLSQLWITGGTDRQTQTVEAGWIVCPIKFNTMRPTLFVYWTPDNYATGSYNLERNHFVQTNHAIPLGAPLPNVSTVGGQQHGLWIGWFFTDNAWWLYINRQRVGYYAPRLFKNGFLSRGIAEEMVIGGETSTEGSLPAMGSGRFAADGPGHSAYIRNINRFLPNGSFQPLDLNRNRVTANCYSFEKGREPDWDSHFFYGGPGR